MMIRSRKNGWMIILFLILFLMGLSKSNFFKDDQDFQNTQSLPKSEDYPEGRDVPGYPNHFRRPSM